ncbi:MAG: PorT family protein [Cyclobacteriaceae bacterium]|nr:PorT family protein [Cyclobacteriaceae bacterium]
MKKIIPLFLILFLFSKSQAQVKVHVGVSTAMNSTFVLDKGLKADPRYLSTATYKWAPVGFSFGIDLGKRFGLQLESIKAAQGQIYEVRDAFNQIVGQRNFDMSYLQFPLMLKMMGGSDKAARMNFQIGPQLSIIQTGTEVLKYAQSIQNIPDGVMPPQGAVELPDGTFEVPAVDEIISGTNEIEGALYKFKEREIQLAAAIGLDIDIMRNFYLSTNIRANYSFTDMRGQDLIDLVKAGNVSEIFNQRANLAVGVQLALHWMIGGTRRANAKDKKLRDAMKSE